MSRRELTLLNAGVRLAYGVAVTLWPSGTADTPLPLAPDTDDRPKARLFVRGFAAHQIGVALAGLASLRSPQFEPAAIALAGAIDALDVVTALIEGRARGHWDEDLLGGMIFSGVGVATALVAWHVD